MDQDFQCAEREQLMRFAAIVFSSLVVSMSALAGTEAMADVPSAVEPGHVPEPHGFHQGAMHGYTPNTIAGGKVVDTAQLEKIIASDHPLLLDVSEKDRKPPSMDKDMIWLPNHRSIPGAVFLQGGGKGETDPAYSDAFKKRVDALTDGDKNKPIVTFCHPDCWGSWNAARRLIGDGYQKVYWYPDGTEGWQTDHDTRLVKPDTSWVEKLPSDATQ